MKPQKLALIVAGSVLGFFAVAGAAVYLTWNLSGTHRPDRMAQQKPVQFAGWQDALPPMAPVVDQDMPMDMRDLGMQMPGPGWNPGFGAAVAPDKLAEIRRPAAADLKITGPHRHDNLALFLIHGPDTMKGKQVVTLHEAVKRGQAVVHDTGPMLAVENRSGSDLFIQSGDIVKGGNQDRSIQYDLLVPANSGRVPLAAFCVEAGRSSPRGLEPGRVFGSATDQLPGKRLRLAILQQHSQQAVWQGVGKIQQDLKIKLGESVQSSLSTTSLQLTLENNRLGQTVQNYLQELSPILEGKQDVIGVVVAINGRLHSADLYASADLFRALYPKLLKAAAIEALAEPARAEAAPLPAAESIANWLAEADKGPAYQQTVNGRIHMIRQESTGNFQFDTCDRNQDNLVVHRCVLVK